MRRRTLITSPLEWQMTALPVAHPALPATAERGGTQLRTPRPVIIVDTREQNPFSFLRFNGWFSGVEKKALELGDYSVAGLENSCVVERKDLGDLVRSFTAERPVFIERLRRMSAFPDRLLVVTAALSQVKSRYEHSPANPNQITQSLIAALAGLRVPFLCVETHELGEEIVASYLYQVHLYHWLEENGQGRRLADDDL
jgi:ERCC4-type nuclease